MVVDLELVGLVACQLLWTGIFIWILIDGGYFEKKPVVVNLGRVYLNENGKIKRVYSGAGVGSFQGVVQGTGVEPVESFDRSTSHLQRTTTTEVGQGAGSIHSQFGEGVSREVRGGEGEGSPNGGRGSYRERIERRAIECGLFGPRVKND